MRLVARNFSPKKNIDSLIAAALGFFIILLFARHGGIGISPDSVTYLSVARSINTGKGLIEFDEMPFVDFPAFYPIFLGAISFITRIDIVVFAPVLNGLLFAILLYLSGSIMNGFSFSSKWYKRILLSCFVFSPCLLEIYSMLWSETLFMLLLLFFIMAARRYLNTHKLSSLFVLSVIVAISCVTRYAGVVLVGTGGMLLILDSGLRFKTRMRNLLLFTIISISLLAINLTRNLMISGFAAGQRQKGTTPLLDNIYFFGGVLSDWFPLANNNPVAFISVLVCIGVCITIFLIFLRNRARYSSYENIAAAFCIAYSFFMLISATFSRYEQFSSRLLSPLFIPLLWCLSSWFPPFVNKFGTLKRSGLVILSLLLVSFFQNYQLAADYETYDGVKDAGIPGYTEDPFPQSDIVTFIKNNQAFFKSNFTVYSNAADAFYFYSGRSAHLLPQYALPMDVLNFYREDQQYIVWFNDIENSDVLTMKDIISHKKLTLIKQFNEGAIYICE
ncbi:MAG TPA: hypothetical protein VMH01_09150 [Puia sp.]|nr:hypothetical protein [Puia sp.]